jgi:hypothetical protein
MVITNNPYTFLSLGASAAGVAIQSFSGEGIFLDCFAALAMTV